MKRAGLAAVVLAAVGFAAAWVAYFAQQPPRVFVPPDPRVERPPLEDCTRGTWDPLTPAAWSVVEEAAIYHAAITSEFFSGRSPFAGQTRARPERVFIDPRSIEPLVPPGHTDPWPMNWICRESDLRLDTAISFRRANRSPGAPVFRLVQLPAPITYMAVPSIEAAQELHDAHGKSALRIRLSRAGFSADFTQALVVLEHSELPGFIEGLFFVLERRHGRWVVVHRRSAWAT